MATISPNTDVTLNAAWMRQLSFAPPSADAVVVVHQLALRAPASSLTLAAHFAGDEVTWVGAVDENMLSVGQASAIRDGRKRVAARLLRGSLLWRFLIPGYLLKQRRIGSTTVYGGSRPWLLVGELTNGSFLALPVNDASGQEKWYAPQIDATALPTHNPKTSQLELAHLWSFPNTCHVTDPLDVSARPRLEEALRSYYR